METPVRVYLTGELCVETPNVVTWGRDLGGRQCRLAFAYLALQRGKTVSRGELAAALWGEEPPRAWETALNAVVSNLRAALARAGLSRAETIEQSGGAYRLTLPAGTIVDVETLAAAVDEAEGLIRSGQTLRAYGPAGVATAIGRRALLEGDDALWLEAWRARQRSLWVRALACFAAVMEANGEPNIALSCIEDILALEPFDERAYRDLMRLHMGAGNRAQALRAYERCRTLLREELGVDPAGETQEAYLAMLRG